MTQLPSKFIQIERKHKLAENDFHTLVYELNKVKLQNLLLPQIPLKGLATKVSDNIVTSAITPIPECLTCGACCAFLLCVSVKPTDSTADSYLWKITDKGKLGDTVVDEFMRRNIETAACIALSGEVGEAVGCKIYEDRPQVCREFEAGSDKCHAIRRSYGIEPPLTVEKVLESRFRLELRNERQNFAESLLYAKITDHPEKEKLLIIAVMEDGSRNVIHIFDPSLESWVQAEFAGLNLLEAFDLINQRSVKHD